MNFIDIIPFYSILGKIPFYIDDLTWAVWWLETNYIVAKKIFENLSGFSISRHFLSDKSSMKKGKYIKQNLTVFVANQKLVSPFDLFSWWGLKVDRWRSWNNFIILAFTKIFQNIYRNVHSYQEGNDNKKQWNSFKNS